VAAYAIMTTVAYIAFTFLACIMGLGLGLMLHRIHLKRVALPDVASLPDDDATYEALHKWQIRENRTFAWTMSSCAAAPLVLALIGWQSRTEVVHTLCSGINTVLTKSPLCF
jgi:hypothetical protein